MSRFDPALDSNELLLFSGSPRYLAFMARFSLMGAIFAAIPSSLVLLNVFPTLTSRTLAIVVFAITFLAQMILGHVLYHKTRYAVTSQCVVIQRGGSLADTHEIPIRKIKDTYVRRSVLGALLGVATLVLIVEEKVKEKGSEKKDKSATQSEKKNDGKSDSKRVSNMRITRHYIEDIHYAFTAQERIREVRFGKKIQQRKKSS